MIRTGVIVDVKDARVISAIGRIQSAAQAEGLRAVAGRAVRNLIREHLFDLNRRRHKYGRGFYAQAARTVAYAVMPDGVRIPINYPGFRLRYYGTAGLPGGVLRPKNAKLLTIPNEDEPEAYGHRAREFDGLKIEWRTNPETGRLQMALVKAAAQQEIVVRRRRNGQAYIKRGRLFEGGEIFYWLTPKVSQKADPSVLPPGFVIMHTATEAMAAALGLSGARFDVGKLGGNN